VERDLERIDHIQVDPMAENESDVIVIGAGHNALTAAAYLAKTGLSITVLEARNAIGGGTITEELTGPGFHHDTFSTGHPWLLTNPIFTADELGIFRDGLSYVGNDPLVVFPFPNGESVTVWRDRHRTAVELARYSKRDAEAWVRHYDEWATLLPVHLARTTTAPGQAPPSDPQLEARYEALLRRTCWETTHDRFESEQARAVALWFGMVVVQPLDKPGTGLYPISVPPGWSDYGWLNPVGGSVRLPEAIAKVVTAHGGRILTGARVVRIDTEGGRATRARVEDGRVFHARKAVVSSIHAANLPGVTGAVLPDAFTQGMRRWRAGPGLFVVYLAMPANQRVRTRDGSIAAVLGAQATVEGVHQQLENTAAGRLSYCEPYILAACSSWIDPSRSPEGKGTVKVITYAPYDLDGDPANWEAAKESYAQLLVEEYAKLVVGFRPGDELGRHAHSPVDIERINPSYYRGAAQGGEMLPDQMGLNRPVKGWANYRLPIPGLYQTGTSAHPGGPVSGWPGRHAARAVLEDLQFDWRRVMPDKAPGPAPEVRVIDTSTY
jgi:phytoene dehydrogenase-like protein